MEPFSATLNSPGVQRIAELLEQLVAQDKNLRLLQAQNAPAARYLRAFNVAAGNVLTIAEAQSGAEVFTGVSIFFFSTSGSGSYSIMGGQVATAALGIEIPLGGAQIELQGMANIAAFTAIPVGGNLIGAYVLFQ